MNLVSITFHHYLLSTVHFGIVHIPFSYSEAALWNLGVYVCFFYNFKAEIGQLTNEEYTAKKKKKKNSYSTSDNFFQRILKLTDLSFFSNEIFIMKFGLGRCFNGFWNKTINNLWLNISLKRPIDQ